MDQDNKFIRAHIQNAQRGKIVSLEELFQMNINRIYAIILRMTNSKSLAGMVAFNVLIKVWKNIKNYPEDISFGDWMIRIAVEMAFEELKTGKLSQDKKLQKQIKTESGVEEFLTVPLEKAMSDLNFESRTSIVLNRIEHFSFDEITELTGITEDEAKEYLINGIGEISRVFSEPELEIGEIQEIEELPTEIEPDRDIIQFTIEKIRETKEEEFKEEDVEFEEIEKLPKHKIKFKKVKVKVEKREFKLNKKYVRAGFILIALIALIYYLTLESYEWTLSGNTGTTFLNDKAITQSMKVSSDDIITTGPSSSASLEIKKLAMIKISSGSKLKRLGGSNCIEFSQGRIKVSSNNDDDYIFIEVPKAIVEEYYLNDDFTVYTDDAENTVVDVSSGWLRIVSGQTFSLVPEGYSIRVLNGLGLSAPTATGTSANLVSLFDDYLFSGKRMEVLDAILQEATPSEAITLWNLLYRVLPAHRGIVYEKLSSLVSPPTNVTKEGIINLNDEILQSWLEEIEWLL